ncbi:serine O-acetyltransferase [Endozoicomonas sp. ONNA2]|uniref:serine O-acetyltransferase n=1 Tax=Endozoicomonas sp. ONNA2 TaxID=2828741 RepID=UPI00359F1618
MCHGVTFGQRAGKYPTIGDYVYISPGACIIGDIKIGNHVLIGPNAVVTESVPDHGVVIGNPAQVISNKGSRKYIRNPFHG